MARSRLRHYRAEDYLLGRLVRRADTGFVLCEGEVETVSGAKTLSSVWQRHRRWAILRRRLGGLTYGAEALAGTAPWAIGAVLASGGAAGLQAAALGLWLTGLAIEARILRPTFRASDLALIALRDLGLPVLFCAGLFGSRTRWRGRKLIVGCQTRIETEERRGRVGRARRPVPTLASART